MFRVVVEAVVTAVRSVPARNSTRYPGKHALCNIKLDRMLKQKLLLGLQHGGYRAIIRCQPCPASLTSRRRWAAPPALDVGDAACPNNEEGSLLASTLAIRHLALGTNPIATISMPYASELPCAVDSVSLLRGFKTYFYRSRIRTHTHPDAAAIHYRR